MYIILLLQFLIIHERGSLSQHHDNRVQGEWYTPQRTHFPPLLSPLSLLCPQTSTAARPIPKEESSIIFAVAQAHWVMQLPTYVRVKITDPGQGQKAGIRRHPSFLSWRASAHEQKKTRMLPSSLPGVTRNKRYRVAMNKSWETVAPAKLLTWQIVLPSRATTVP